MNDFAKLLVADDGEQVLFFKDRDREDNPAIHRMTVLSGVTATMVASYHDTGDGWDKMEEEFEKIDQGYANRFREYVKEMFREDA